MLLDKTRLTYGSIFSQHSKVRFYCCATPRTIFSIKYRIKTLWSVEKRVREGIHLFQVEFVKSNEEHHCEKSRTSFVILLFMQISLLPLLVVFHKSNVSIGDQTHIVFYVVYLQTHQNAQNDTFSEKVCRIVNGTFFYNFAILNCKQKIRPIFGHSVHLRSNLLFWKKCHFAHFDAAFWH